MAEDTSLKAAVTELNSQIADKVEAWLEQRLSELQPASVGTALQGMGIKTIIDFGADPTGKKDSAEAFEKAAATGTILVPPGQYMIDRTVKLRDDAIKRPVIQGFGFSHFGQHLERAGIFNGANLSGAFFDGAYRVSGVPFFGKKCKDGTRPKVCLEATAYFDRIDHCAFNGFDVAVNWTGGITDCSIRDCMFTGVGLPWKVTGVTTVSRFIDNLLQYVDNCGEFGGEVWSTRIEGNTWERVAGEPLTFKTLFDSSLRDNWWEHRNGGADSMPIKITANQQSHGNVYQGNHTQGGWTNIFDMDEEGGNGYLGGVAINNNNIRVRHATGQSIKLHPGGIESQTADWAGTNDFILRGGKSSATGAVHDVVLRLYGRGGAVRFDSMPEGNERGVFKSEVTFTTQTDDKAKVTQLTGFKPTRDSKGVIAPGFLGRSQIAKTATEIAEAAIGIPFVFTWYGQDKKFRHGEMFTKTEQGDGWVKVTVPFRLDNPMVQVTVEDRGITPDGWELSGGKVTAVDNRYGDALKLFFVDRNGKAATPKSVHISVQPSYKLS